MPDAARATERFHAIAEAVLGADLPVDPWLYRYCGSARNPDGAERYVRYHLDELALAKVDPEGLAIVDAGCGFGFLMVLDAILGARRVHGVEVNPSMVEAIEMYMPLVPGDVASRIEVACASVTEMPIDDGSADVVLSIEAISDYREVEEFIEEARRALRPGGVLLIVDGNNASNPTIRRQVYEVWEAAERGRPTRRCIPTSSASPTSRSAARSSGNGCRS